LFFFEHNRACRAFGKGIKAWLARSLRDPFFAYSTHPPRT